MQGMHTSKMSLRFAFTLLLTLLGSAQAFNLWTEEATPSPLEGIPNEWKREDSLLLPEKNVEPSLGSQTFSGDGEIQSVNQHVTAATGQYDENATTTSPSQTTFSNSINTENSATQQNVTGNPITPKPSLGPSTTIIKPKTPSPENSTVTTKATSNTTTTSTPAINITQNSTTTVSGNFTTTRLPQFANITQSPSMNSTNTTVSTTTTLQNYTSAGNESSTVSTTRMNTTGEQLRENVDRGPSTDIAQQTKSQAWGAVLGIGVGVAIVALVVYIIVKRRNYRDFSHRKLVEDVPPNLVLRLDNSEPLDLKFGGYGAYYNPEIQGDNIQMTNFPQGQSH